MLGQCILVMRQESEDALHAAYGRGRRGRARKGLHVRDHILETGDIADPELAHEVAHGGSWLDLVDYDRCVTREDRAHFRAVEVDLARRAQHAVAAWQPCEAAQLLAES